MIKVAIYGSDERARRLWEALTLRGADIVAFIDVKARRHGRPFLSAVVQPISWLARGRFDVVAISDADWSDPGVCTSLAIVNRARILTVPADASDEALASLVAARVPHTLLPAPPDGEREDAVRVGVFGTGSAAMKVWEACAEIDEAEVVWFADNNPHRQGRTLLWLDVIAPADIASRTVDRVVIGSMSRAAIHNQLCDLGIRPERILAPDVSGDIRRIRTQLATAIRQHVSGEIAQ